MKLVSLHPLIWSSLLVLWTPHRETGASSPDVCQEDYSDLEPVSSGEYHVEKNAVLDNFYCFLYPTNILNCSWSFLTLSENAQLLVSISVCDDDTLIYSEEYSKERTGSCYFTLPKINYPSVILQFNITLNDTWTVYTAGYDRDMIEVLSPPKNISALVKNGSLLVTWDLPQSLEKINSLCFEYQLDLGDQEVKVHTVSPEQGNLVFTGESLSFKKQEGFKELSSGQSYTQPSIDPSRTYRVRIRARQEDSCQKNSHWSEWSPTVESCCKAVIPPPKLNVLVIVAISLGVPMILLAVLLLICHQRVSKVLFPPIPRPPSKYKFFLEKSDTFNLFYPPQQAEPEAEITEVEDTEQKPGKTFN